MTYKELLSKEVLKSIYDGIMKGIETGKIVCYTTDSGYYYTTRKVASKKLREKYGIEYVRCYKHIPTDFAVLYIQFTNGEHLKLGIKSLGIPTNCS